MEKALQGINRGNRQETTNHRADTPVNPERKWIRLMEVGLSLILAVPLAVCAGYLLKGSILIVMVPLALVMAGYCCLRIGYEQRMKLKENKDGRDVD